MEYLEEFSKLHQVTSRFSDKEAALSFLNFVLDLEKDESWKNSKELYNKVFNKGRYIIDKYGRQTPVINVALRVLKIIREECAEVVEGKPELDEHATNFLFSSDSSNEIPIVNRDDLWEFVRAGVQTMKDEVIEDLTNINVVLPGETVAVYINTEDQNESNIQLTNQILLALLPQNVASLTVLLLVNRSTSNGQIYKLLSSSRTSVTIILVPERSSNAVLQRCNRLLIIGCHGDGVPATVRCPTGSLRVIIDALYSSVSIQLVLPSYLIAPLTSQMHNHHHHTKYDTLPSHILSSHLLSFITTSGIKSHAELLSLARSSFYSPDVAVFLKK